MTGINMHKDRTDAIVYLNNGSIRYGKISQMPDNSILLEGNEARDLHSVETIQLSEIYSIDIHLR
jgi:hypothetical protein